MFLAVGLVVGLFAVVISFSRGGFVGLIAMFAVVFLYSKRKLLTLGLILLLVIMLILVIDPALSPQHPAVVRVNRQSCVEI